MTNEYYHIEMSNHDTDEACAAEFKFIKYTTDEIKSIIKPNEFESIAATKNIIDNIKSHLDKFQKIDKSNKKKQIHKAQSIIIIGKTVNYNLIINVIASNLNKKIIFIDNKTITINNIILFLEKIYKLGGIPVFYNVFKEESLTALTEIHKYTKKQSVILNKNLTYIFISESELIPRLYETHKDSKDILYFTDMIKCDDIYYTVA